jgi:hypothetical protein
MINEIVPIEQPSVNVIKLTNDFVHNLPRPRHHTFVVNLLDVPSACQCHAFTRSFKNSNYSWQHKNQVKVV